MKRALMHIQVLRIHYALEYYIHYLLSLLNVVMFRSAKQRYQYSSGRRIYGFWFGCYIRMDPISSFVFYAGASGFSCYCTSHPAAAIHCPDGFTHLLYPLKQVSFALFIIQNMTYNCLQCNTHKNMNTAFVIRFHLFHIMI